MANPSPELVSKWTKVIDAPTRSGNRVDYLIDGLATYESMYAALQTTLKGDASAYYVCFLGWWLDENLRLKSGDPGSAFVPLLGRLAEKGVQIRVMLYDNILKWGYAKFFRAGQVPSKQVASISRMPGAAAILDGHVVGYPMFQSHHHKLLLVRGSEGLIGFCGGLDVALDRIQHSRPKWHDGSPFHDVHCRIQGPAARDLVSVFVQRWMAHPEGPKIRPELRALKDLPPVRDGGATNDKPVGDQYVGIVRTFVLPAARRHSGSKREKGPCTVESSFQKTLMSAIAASRRFIYAEDQYMVSTDVARALGQALNNLQFVYILIPHTLISDLRRCWDARVNFVDALLSSARREHQKKFKVFYKLGASVGGKVLSEPPVLPIGPSPPSPRSRSAPPDWDTPPSSGLPIPSEAPPVDPSIPKKTDFGPHTYVHSKIWIFDDELALIGTANCNRRGLYFDSEVDAAIFDVTSSLRQGQYSFAQRLRMDLWAEHLTISAAQAANPSAKTAEALWFKPPGNKWVREYRAHDRLPQTLSDWWWAPPILGSAPVPETTPLDSPPKEERERAWDVIMDPISVPPDKCRS